MAFDVTGGASGGFLNKLQARAAVRMGPRMGPAFVRASNWYQRSPMHFEASQWFNQALGMSYKTNTLGTVQRGLWRNIASGKLTAGKLFGAGLFMGGTIYAGVKGYQEEGAWGATKGVAGSLAGTYAFGAAFGAAKSMFGFPVGKATYKQAARIAVKQLGPTATRAAKDQLARQIMASSGARMGILNPLLTAAVIGYAAYKIAPKAIDIGRKRVRRARSLNFGTPAADPFGMLYTERQRSINAIQRSALNGRYALGSEASILGV